MKALNYIFQAIKLVIEKILSLATGFLPETARLPAKILMAAFAVFFLLIVTKPETKPYDLKEKAWPVSAHKAQYEKIGPELSTFGEIVTARQIDLRTLVSGEVISVAPGLEEGAFVKKGETLLTIDPFNYENALAEAEAQLLGAEGAFATSKTDYERAQKLYEKGTVAKKYLDDRRADFLMKKGSYDRLKIVVRRANRDLENTRVVAPYDAYVSNVNAREGRFVGPNDFIAKLSDASNYELRFNLSDAEYGALLSAGSPIVDQPVTAIWSIGNKEFRFAGKVRRVGALIDQKTRGVDIYADIQTGEDTVLRGGAFVKVRLDVQPLERVVVLPLDALNSQDELFVIKDSRLEMRQAEVFLRSGNKAYVTGGLEDGDLVLLTRFNEVSTGLLVEVK